MSPSAAPTELAGCSCAADKTACVRSVEILHVYLDEQLNHHHEAMVDATKRLLTPAEHGCSRVLLLDDYNVTSRQLSPVTVVAFLDQHELPVDAWAYESDLIPNAQVLMAEISESRLRRRYQRYIKSHVRYPCSLLTAAWYATRLGYLDGAGVLRCDEDAARPIAASRVLNLLPSDYQPVEAQALELLGASAFAEAVEQIENRFLPLSSGATRLPLMRW